jgi:hypothetical protein
VPLQQFVRNSRQIVGRLRYAEVDDDVLAFRNPSMNVAGGCPTRRKPMVCLADGRVDCALSVVGAASNVNGSRVMSHRRPGFMVSALCPMFR